MRINSNIPALTAFNALTRNNNAINNVIRQVSTGFRINTAADDAAGLAISENMRAQMKSLDRALQNAQDGISLIQTAEGALGETNSILQRMRELSVQAANDTLTAQDRSYIQLEIDELKANIDRIANTTHFNGKSLLDGSVCGNAASTDMSTKVYIRGAIEAEGNYRLEVKANPGQAQVQKSSIMKVKHENVVTNLQTDILSGIEGVSINNVPAGDYSIMASMGAGGEISYRYDSVFSGNVTEANTTGVPETMTIRFSYEGGYEELQVTLEAEDTKPENIATRIVDKINDTGSFTADGENITLKATLHDNGTYTIKTSGSKEITSFESLCPPTVKASTAISITNPSDKEVWTAFTVPSSISAVGSPKIIYGDKSVTLNHDWSATSNTAPIAQEIKDTLINEFGLSDAYITKSGSDYIVWAAAGNVTHDIRGEMSASATVPTPTNPEPYKINASGTVSSGNSSTDDETITIKITGEAELTVPIPGTIPGKTEKQSYETPESVLDLIEQALKKEYQDPDDCFEAEFDAQGNCCRKRDGKN